MRNGLLCLFMLILLMSQRSYAKDKLIVYSYSSFVSKWGPANKLKTAFESECRCELEWVGLSDVPAIIARLKLESKKPRADVVVGIDDSATADPSLLGYFEMIQSEVGPMSKAIAGFKSDAFVPISFGYVTLMYNKKFKSKDQSFVAPRSLSELLEQERFKNAVILQDPRTSGPGASILFWLHAIYGDKTKTMLEKLKLKTLTVSRNWSDSYGLFTKGEAPLVFSYTTSEAYHLEQDKTDQYQSLDLKEGHYVSIETAAILKTSKQKNLAKMFLSFIQKPQSQGIIASNNWMYPAFTNAASLPSSFTKIKEPQKALRLSPKEIYQNKTKWFQEWSEVFAK